MRAGHTEAAVDLAALAGLYPAGVICEIVNDDGTMARLPELVRFKHDHGLKLISIADLIEYRRRKERLVELISVQPFSCPAGDFVLRLFRSRIDDRIHTALTLGEPGPGPTLVRVHSENRLGDVFGGGQGHGRAEIDAALELIRKMGHGVLLYIAQKEGGIRAGPKMDERDYGIGAQMLAELGLRRIRLLTTRPRRVVALTGYDLEIVEQLPLHS